MGLLSTNHASLVRDVEILKQARDAAFEVIAHDPDLKNEKKQMLKKELERARLSIVG